MDGRSQQFAKKAAPRRTKKADAITFWHWFRARLKYFCSVTALHGYGHIVREGTPLWERVFWAVITVVASIVAVVLLYVSWQWNSETPVVTVIESTHYATWNIPFPAVTFCNLNKISKKAALATAAKMKRPNNYSDDHLVELFRSITLFQSGILIDTVNTELDQLLRQNNMTINDLEDRITPRCTDMFERCMWKGTQTRCDTLFQSIQTSYGLCCSFNYYGKSKSNYPTKIVHSIPKSPRRVTACGFQTGLSVIMSPESDDYHTTVIGSYGFRVLIHDSYDYPDHNAEIKIITSRMESFLSVSPEATYYTRDVAELPVETRNCFLEHDIKLSVFQRYSYLNCMAECRSMVALDKCGCIPHLMPNNGSFPVCQLDKLACILAHKNYIDAAFPGTNSSIVRLYTDVANRCNCRPDCDSIQYPTELSLGLFTRNNSFNEKSFFKDVTLTDQSLVHVFFNDLVSTRYRMDIFQNWLGTLATFGGILGLFLGFSLITGFELVYLFTFRVAFDLIATKRTQRNSNRTVSISN